jgi:hypothetical protein
MHGCFDNKTVSKFLQVGGWDTLMNEWMDAWIDGLMDEWIDGCMEDFYSKS